jgi:hypothetical protein
MRQFGPELVFMDVDSIEPGQNFSDHLSEVLGQCDVMVAMMGSCWPQRLIDESDWVRLEIETAITRKIPIIPVLIDKTKMPGKSTLPETIQKLTYFQATTLDTVGDFDGDMQRLIMAISRYLPDKRSQVSIHCRTFAKLAERFALGAMTIASELKISRTAIERCFGFEKSNCTSITRAQFEKLKGYFEKLANESGFDDLICEFDDSGQERDDQKKFMRREIYTQDTGRSLKATIYRSPEIRELCRDRVFAVSLYRALTQNVWYRTDPRVESMCSWRDASTLITIIRNIPNEYSLQFYCSRGEGAVEPRIREILHKLGWTCMSEPLKTLTFERWKKEKILPSD